MDVEAGLPEYTDDDGVIVPETTNPLDEAAFVAFLDSVSAVERADPWDTEPYIYALQALDNLLPEES